MGRNSGTANVAQEQDKVHLKGEVGTLRLLVIAIVN
jgi:hypothetical protein